MRPAPPHLHLHLHRLLPLHLLLRRPLPVPLRRRCHPSLVHNFQQQQQRTFLGFSRALPQPPPPGISTIEKLVGTLSTHEGRPPPAETLVSAFRDVVRKAAAGAETITDEHAHGLARTYQHLKGAIPAEDVRAALRALRGGGGGGNGSLHVAGLARMLFSGLEEHTGEDVEVFVGVLARSGSAWEAAEVVRRFSGEGGGGVLGEGQVQRCWELVMRGLEAGGTERELLEMWEDVRESVPVVTAGMMGPLVRFYCRLGEVRKAQQWYGRLVEEEGLTPELETYIKVLRLCADQGENVWAQEIFNSILNGAVVSREAWDIVLQWADVITKDSNEISRLLTIMVKRAATTNIYPSIETFNELIRFAISRGDYKAARKHHKLAIHRKFTPNRRTLELQIEYLVLSNKIKLAQEVYDQLLAEELPPSYPAPSVQLLLQALCRDPNPDKQLINRIHIDLGEWNSPLQIGTTTALLNHFLTDCDFSAVIALLNGPSCATYTAADRHKIIHEMGEYIGRDTTSIEAAWDTYQILYQVFPELSIRQRTDIMRLFFTLDRSDMATMVFKHMRGTPGRRPGKQGYIVALNGVAYARDIDALKVIHNALKLDPGVDLDTALTGALMNAYNRCGIPWRVMRFWEDVKRSAEGPDYQSISVVFEACGNLWDGTARAKILWGQLRSMGVKLTVDNYRAYIEALGKGEQFEEAFRLAREMELSDGVKPNVKLLGTVYATASHEMRDKIAEWATETYPTEWKEVETRIEQLPRDILKQDALEALGGSQLQNLLMQGQQPASSSSSILAIEEGGESDGGQASLG